MRGSSFNSTGSSALSNIGICTETIISITRAIERATSLRMGVTGVHEKM